MILDEPMVMPLSKPIKVSFNGDDAIVDSIEFKPPFPHMAKDTFKMKRYFNQIQKEAMSFASSINQTSKEAATQQLHAGDPIKAVHESYKDGDEQSKQDKLADIEETIEGFTQLLVMCNTVDLYQMTVDFGKMVIAHNRCNLKGEGSISVIMTSSLWEQNVQPDDRLIAAIRYCCFFGLVSSLIA